MISLADAKLHLRVEIAEDDDLIARLVDAAVQHVEQIIGCALNSRLTQKRIRIDNRPVRLAPHPVTAVTAIEAGQGAAWADVSALYTVDLTERPGLVIPTPGAAALVKGDELRITFTAGFATMPPALRQACLMLVGHWYENREGVVTGTISSEVSLGVTRLCSPFQGLRLT